MYYPKDRLHYSLTKNLLPLPWPTCLQKGFGCQSRNLRLLEMCISQLIYYVCLPKYLVTRSYLTVCIVLVILYFHFILLSDSPLDLFSSLQLQGSLNRIQKMAFVSVGIPYSIHTSASSCLRILKPSFLIACVPL